MIWRRRQLILWWLVSAAAVAALTAWLALLWHVRMRHEIPAGSAAAYSSLSLTHEWLHANLTLSPEQHEKLERIAAETEKEQAECRERIRQAEREIAVVLRAGDEHSPSLPGAMQQLSTAQTALHQAAVRHYFAVCRVLDDSQRRSFAQWNTERLTTP